MRESFDWFWEYRKSIPVQHLTDVAHKLLKDESTELKPYQIPDRLQLALKRIDDYQKVKRLFLDSAYEIDRIEYFSDKPRKAEYAEESSKQDITAELYEVLSSATTSVVLQSPYMVLSKNARKLFKQLRKTNPDIELVYSTNSLAASDADTVYANTDKHKKHYVKTLGFLMYEFKPSRWMRRNSFRAGQI